MEYEKYEKVNYPAEELGELRHIALKGEELKLLNQHPGWKIVKNYLEGELEACQGVLEASKEYDSLMRAQVQISVIRNLTQFVEQTIESGEIVKEELTQIDPIG